MNNTSTGTTNVKGSSILRWIRRPKPNSRNVETTPDFELHRINSTSNNTIPESGLESETSMTTKNKQNNFGRVVTTSLKNLAPDRDTQILNLKNRKYKKIKSSVMAIYVGLLAAVGGFLYGYDTGMVNGLLEMEYVKTNFSGNGISFSSKERAILTAIMSLGTFVGSLVAPLGSDRYGRKRCMIWTLLIIFSIGIILQICSEDFDLLLAGRFVTGIGVGVISSIVPLFQAEISPRWIRGSIISFYQWAITWGLMASSAITQGTRRMDDARSFRIPTGLQFAWSGVLLVGLLYLPESPRFYVMKNDLDGAIISLSRLRRLTVDDDELIEELVEIKASHDYELSDGDTSYLDCFRSSNGRVHQLLRMMTCFALQTFQQSSGINFIFYYGVNFFVGTGVPESYLMSFITYAVNVVFTLPGILLVDRLGRRKLLIIGALGMAVSNFIIAIVGLNTDSVISNKVMLAFVCLFIAFFASSWGPVVWVVTGELFSLSIRQKAVSLAATTNWVVNFVFAYSTPYIIDQGNDTHGTLGTNIFFLWGSMNMCALFVVVFFVYETKGLMLEEVNELYRRCPNAFGSQKMNSEILQIDMFQKENGMYGAVPDIGMTSQDSTQKPGDSNHIDGIQYDDMTMNSSIRPYPTNNTHGDCSLSPMDYLKQWDEKQEKQRILSDNILTRQSNTFPSFLDADSSLKSMDDSEQLEGTSGDISKGRSGGRHESTSSGRVDSAVYAADSEQIDHDDNDDNDDDSGVDGTEESEEDSDDDIDPELNFNFGIYGEDNEPGDIIDTTQPIGSAYDEEEDTDEEEQYRLFIAQVAADIGERSGVDVRPLGNGSQ